MVKRIAALFISASMMLGAVGVARAQSTLGTEQVSYLSGYSMVGAPAGTSFSGAVAFYTYTNGQYVTPSAQTTATCAGYWAYFVNPTTVTLPVTAASNAGAVQNCPLSVGWNLVGNSFAGVATLPPGVTGWYWNHDRRAYDRVTSIPVGGAVWIDAPVALTLTLTAQPVTTTTHTEIDITDSTIGPVTLHVGDSLKVVMLAALPEKVGYDSRYMQADTGGTTYEMTCSGNACELNPASSFWIGHAILAGDTTLVLNPACLSSTPPCYVASRVIALHILP
jgi:hypothetical protein